VGGRSGHRDGPSAHCDARGQEEPGPSGRRKAGLHEQQPGGLRARCQGRQRRAAASRALAPARPGALHNRRASGVCTHPHRGEGQRQPRLSPTWTAPPCCSSPTWPDSSTTRRGLPTGPEIAFAAGRGAWVPRAVRRGRRRRRAQAPHARTGRSSSGRPGTRGAGGSPTRRTRPATSRSGWRTAGAATRVPSPTRQGSTHDPVWSPDGTRVAFVTRRTGTLAIWTMNPDGSDPRPLLPEDKEPMCDPFWR
jgi:hypothetical protein